MKKNVRCERCQVLSRCTNCGADLEFDLTVTWQNMVAALMNVPLPVKKLNPRAIIPEYHTADAVAFDAPACLPEGEEMVVMPGEQVLIPTGLAFAIPKGFELRVSPRSGQAAKKAISIRNSPGIIDPDYRGELMIIFVNNAKEPFPIKHGDRVAQIKLSLAPRAEFVEVEELPETERGEGGFGSTGLK